jgi:hypothetical protein
MVGAFILTTWAALAAGPAPWGPKGVATESRHTGFVLPPCIGVGGCAPYITVHCDGASPRVYGLSITGDDTVLDALAQVPGLPPVASRKRIWLERPAAHGGESQVLPVDWKGITACGRAETNYALRAGDRIYVEDRQLFVCEGKLVRLSPFDCAVIWVRDVVENALAVVRSFVSKRPPEAE